jgi:hypothetical protein
VRRSQKRFQETVDFYAFVRRDFLGFVRELDIRSRLGFPDDLGQVGGQGFYRDTVIPIVGYQGSLSSGESDRSHSRR